MPGRIRYIQSLDIDRNFGERLRISVNGYEIEDRKESEIFRWFRTIPIFLTQEEIAFNLEPRLRPILVKGKYHNIDIYLDIHYKLLREDLFRAFRRGVNKYINCVNSGQKYNEIKKIKDIRVYESVKIGKRCPKSLTAFWVQFDVQQIGDIDWEHSKRLIYGSLLCLSSNNFQTFCFASVVGDRKVENLSNGFFQLEFAIETLTDEFKHFDPEVVYVMIESEVYFEAYKHTLKTLKRFGKNNFPFESYIIELKKSTSKPKYLSDNSVYDLSEAVINPNEINSYKKVVLKIDNRWPTAELMGFDKNQYKAFKDSLSREFVLIQGPPGTGKTFVGLKIVQTLHRNRNVWNDWRKKQKPIVIICYTNHALDQFLEGMHPFCDNIVRIGGQSKSALLRDCTLTAIRKNAKELQTISVGFQRDVNKCFKNIEIIHKKTLLIDVEINNCRKDLLNLKFLYEFLYEFPNELQSYEWFERQMYSLLENYSNEFDLALIKWITNCDPNESSETDSEFESTSSENDFQINDNLAESETDEQEVNRITGNRKTDEDFCFDFDFDFNESEVKSNNTIFKTNDKSLELISRRVIKQLQKEMTNEITFEKLSRDVMPYEEAIKISDVTQLSYPNRWSLYRLWVYIYLGLKKRLFEKNSKEFTEFVKTLKKIHLKMDLNLLSDSQIVGMTTTGAAKFRDLLEKIDPKIVVIEEAAEVLESHVITSLTKTTEHLILIGDHRQLKPMPAVFELAKKYRLEVSLFERMVENQMPFIQLKLQHRMRPEISKLLVPHIYRKLKDHESVKNYEDIRGMKKNMFFINHSNIESIDDERLSKINEFEAKFVVRLAKHLLYQDYEPKKITILTFYSSQLIYIRKLLKSDPNIEEIQSNSVDNFQGEENDIIIVSFVRSNHNNDIGFLKSPNRLCVALSRAKKGFYCIGNFDCLSESSDLWTEITNYLRQILAIGPKLEFSCPIHPNTYCSVANVNDFNQKSPFGGCSQPYSHDLDCGHSCPLKICHISHKLIQCQIKCVKDLECGHKNESICCRIDFCELPCNRILKCGHNCDLKCGEECQTLCKVLTEKVIGGCGHTVVVECSAVPECDVRCGRVLCCEHECQLKCSESCDSKKCLVIVLKRFVDCGHEIRTECSQDLSELECFNEECYPCNQLLVCGHRCQSSPKECNRKRLHINCQQKCELKLICGHKCSGICGQTCPPCHQICQNRCLHDYDSNDCKHTCSQPCIKCLKSCNWKCKHKKCTKRCFESCDREVCQMSCDKRLSCGHQCIGLCGELCPQFCLICQKPEINDIFGIEDMSDSEIMNSKFIELENCKHLIELKALEILLTTSDQNISDFKVIFKRCPKCQTYITRCQPFNNIIKQQFFEIRERLRLYFCLNEGNLQKQRNLAQILDSFTPPSTVNESEELSLKKTSAKIWNDLREELKYIPNRKLMIKSEYQLSLIANKVIVIKTISEVLKEMKINEEFLQFIKRNVWKDFQLNQIQEYFKRLQTFLDFISEQFVNTSQQIFDSQQELRFFVLFSKLLYISITNQIEDQNINQLVMAFDEVLNSCAFTPEVENDFQIKVFQIIGENIEFNEIQTQLIPNYW